MSYGMHDHTAQFDAKLALLEAARVALEGEKVDISFGFRWPLIQDDWVSGGNTESQIDPKNVGPRMSQDETITLSLSIGAIRPGADEATEIAVARRANELLTRIQDWVRKPENTTLGGVVLWCLPGSSSTVGATAEDEAWVGRVAEISAEFICKHRIRNP